MPGYAKRIVHITLLSSPGKEVLLFCSFYRWGIKNWGTLSIKSRDSNTDSSDLEACNLNHHAALLPVPRALAATQWG